MELLCLGLNHRTAPVEVRERFAVGTSKLGEAAHEARRFQADGPGAAGDFLKPRVALAGGEVHQPFEIGRRTAPCAPERCG